MRPENISQAANSFGQPRFDFRLVATPVGQPDIDTIALGKIGDTRAQIVELVADSLGNRRLRNARSAQLASIGSQPVWVHAIPQEGNHRLDHHGGNLTSRAWQHDAEAQVLINECQPGGGAPRVREHFRSVGNLGLSPIGRRDRPAQHPTLGQPLPQVISEPQLTAENSRHRCLADVVPRRPEAPSRDHEPRAPQRRLNGVCDRSGIVPYR